MFIGRKDGTIYGAWTMKQWEGQEEIADDSPEYIAFRDRPMPSSAKRDAAIEALLAKEALDPLAPQVVKDWATELGTK